MKKSESSVGTVEGIEISPEGLQALEILLNEISQDAILARQSAQDVIDKIAGIKSRLQKTALESLIKQVEHSEGKGLRDAEG